MFAVALKGAADLQQVQNDYQAETGASAEEAKRAGQVINKIAGENQQSLESVSAAAVAVHNDLGLVGDQADKVLASMTQFARVTKQEPVAAVKAFDDILDAWNLTAADSQKIMDTLVLSHQKYGGSVSDDQAALAAARADPARDERDLAGRRRPARPREGVRAQHGDAIAGPQQGPRQGEVARGAAAADRRHQQHRGSVPPGAEGGRPVRPEGRAQARERARREDAHDFKIDMNEAAGATGRAADALDQGFGAQARKKLSEWGATLRGLGADWGPLLTAAGGFGSLLGALGADTLVEKLGPKAIAAFKEIGTQGGQALVDAAGTATGALGTIIGNNISNRVEAIFAPGRDGPRQGVAPPRAVPARHGGVRGRRDRERPRLRRGERGRVEDRRVPRAGVGPIAAKIRPVILAAGIESGLTFGTGVAEGSMSAEAIAAVEGAGTTLGSAFSRAMLAASVIGLGILASQELGKGGNEFLGLPADANNNDRSAEIVRRLYAQNGQKSGEAFNDAAQSALQRDAGRRGREDRRRGREVVRPGDP
jgi:hypothetical protein